MRSRSYTGRWGASANRLVYYPANHEPGEKALAAALDILVAAQPPGQPTLHEFGSRVPTTNFDRRKPVAIPWWLAKETAANNWHKPRWYRCTPCDGIAIAISQDKLCPVCAKAGTLIEAKAVPTTFQALPPGLQRSYIFMYAKGYLKVYQMGRSKTAPWQWSHSLEDLFHVERD
ncbi:unnamed protein product [Sympodiomycopsis kandeliae]